MKTLFVLLAVWPAQVLAQNQPTVQVVNASPDLQVRSVDATTVRVTRTRGSAAGQTLVIADSETSKAPLLRADASSGRVDIGWVNAGMVPGRIYYLRIQPGDLHAAFRFLLPSWSEPQITYPRLKSSWETAGRAWLEPYSGIKWNKTAGTWELDGSWAPEKTGSQAYYVEEGIRGAVNMAITCQDTRLLDEVSQYYLTYLPRFATLGALRSKQALNRDTALLTNQGADAARTLPWIEDPGALHALRVRECTLCNSQFFHPVARLIGGIARLSPAQRTASMARFVSAYRSLLINDHLLRLLYESEWDYWGDKTLPKQLVDIWAALARPDRRSQKSYQSVMEDRDLWLIATTVEMLGANATAPDLVAIAPGELDRLRRAVATGLQLLKVKMHYHADTKTPDGRTFASVSLFDGDWDDHRDYAFTGYEGERFPTESDQKVHRPTSWDVSHSYRIPIFFRSLWENRSVLAMSFPALRDVQLVINQWVFRAFKGSFDRPLFHNFLDGSDGWYRVAYHGSDFGYPPSSSCDTRNEAHRPCLTTGAVQGWGMLAFADADLDRLQHSLIRLALSNDQAAVQFRERYYSWQGQAFAIQTEPASAYPVLVRMILSDAADRVRGCGQ